MAQIPEPHIHVEDSDEAPSFCLRSGTVPAIVAMWCVNQQMEYLSLTFK